MRHHRYHHCPDDDYQSNILMKIFSRKFRAHFLGGIPIIASIVASEFAHSQSIPKTASQGPEVTLELAPSEDNPRNSEGDFITLKDGTILFVYSHFYGTSRSDFGHSRLAARRSRDGGDSWSANDELIVQNEGGVNVMSVSLLRLHDDRIALFYLRKNSMQDCIPLLRYSADEGQTWSDPIPTITDREGYFVLNNDRVIQLEDGRLLMPVALHVTPQDSKRFNERGIIFCYYSDDSGLTWKSGRAIGNKESLLTQEPGVVELKDGRIMMYVRSDVGRQLVSYSRNRGESWTSLEVGGIISPLSPVSMERIPNTGDLLLVWNNNDGSDDRIRGKRTPFNTAISRDEGKTWQNIKTIADDRDTRYCYTAIHFVDDALLLAHVAGRYSDGTRNSIVHITKLNQKWVYDGE